MKKIFSKKWLPSGFWDFPGQKIIPVKYEDIFLSLTIMNNFEITILTPNKAVTHISYVELLKKVNYVSGSTSEPAGGV